MIQYTRSTKQHHHMKMKNSWIETTSYDIFFSVIILPSFSTQGNHKNPVPKRTSNRNQTKSMTLVVADKGPPSVHIHRRWMSTRSPRRFVPRSSLHTRVDEIIAHRNRRKRAPPLFPIIPSSRRNNSHQTEYKFKLTNSEPSEKSPTLGSQRNRRKTWNMKLFENLLFKNKQQGME
jgi:hypothetical protein